MAIQINVPGIGIAEFPDGVTYDQAFESIQEQVPDWQPSRSDVFAKLRSNSDAMAASDNARFLDQEGGGAAQTAYERLAGTVTRGVTDMASPVVRALERPLDSFYANQRKSVRRLGGTMPETFESQFRQAPDEAADAAEVATQGRGSGTLNFLADVAGGIAPTIGATLLTGGVGGFAAAGSQQAGSTRKRVLDYYKTLGLPEEDAQDTADLLGLTSGAITGAVTKYTPEVLGKIPGIGKYLSSEGVEGAAKALLTQRLLQTPVAEIARKAVGSATGEATEEGVNQFLLEVVESKQLEPNLSWNEIAKRTALASAAGAVGGGGVSVLGDVGRAGIERITGNTPPTVFEALANEGRFENAKKELDRTREARNQIDQAREASANELAAMVGIEAPHVQPIQKPTRLAQPISDVESDAGFFTGEQPGGPGLVQMMRESQKKQGRSAVESGLVGPATSYLPEYAAPISEDASTSGVSESIAGGGNTPVDQLLRSNLSSVAATPDANAFDLTTETTPVDAAVMGFNPQRSLPPMREDQQRVLDTAYQTLVSLEDPKAKPDMSLVLQLEQVAPTIKRLVDARIDQAIQVNAKDSDIGPLIDLQGKLKKFTDDLVARRQLSDESQSKLSTADKIYNKLDEWDKSLNDQVRSSVFLGLEVGVAKVVLKTAKLAIRAGQSVSDAIKTAIAKARADFPDAKFNDEALRKEMLSELQGFIKGDEEASPIARAAEPVVAKTQEAVSRIGTKDIADDVYSRDIQELQRKRDEVFQAVLAAGDEPSVVPGDPKSKEIPQLAASYGLDAADIQELQDRINFEDRARVLAGLIKESERLESAAVSLGVEDDQKYEPAIESLLNQKSAVDKKIASDKFDDVRERADAINAYKNDQIGLMAKRDALMHKNVQEAIAGPVEDLRALLEENPELETRTPQEIMEDPFVSDDAKQIIIIRLSTAFRQFDVLHQGVQDDLASTEEQLQRSIDKLTGRLVDAEQRVAFADVVMDDAKRALTRDTSVTGGVSQKWVDWYNNNQEQLRSFARRVSELAKDGSNPLSVSANQLWSWIAIDPSQESMPDIRNAAGNNWGVGDETLSQILSALLASPAIRNAVAGLHDAGSVPLVSTRLREIAETAITGDENGARELFKKLMSRTENERRKVAQSVNRITESLNALKLRLATLKEANSIFDQVADSPIFKEGRLAVETSDDSFWKVFYVPREGEFALIGFQIPKGKKQDDILVNAASSGVSDFSAKAGRKVLEWMESANAYIKTYEDMLADSQVNMAAPHPASEGYDPAVYRGLKYTVEYVLPAMMDATTFDFRNGIDSSSQGNIAFQSYQWLSQLDATAQLVKGIFGRNLSTNLAEWRNIRMDLMTILGSDKFSRMSAARTAAMASHPSLGGGSWISKQLKKNKRLNAMFAFGGNLQKYRELVFDPMASKGRSWGMLDVGTPLISGEVVTKEDIELLKLSKQFGMDNFKSTQTRGKGTELKFGEKAYRRKAGQVGDFGLGRHIGKDGESNILKIAAAVRDAGDKVKFEWNDLVANSSHRIISTWDTLAKSVNALTSHVENSAERTDRDIAVTPFMRQAYRSLNDEMAGDNYANRITSMADLANRLVSHFPTNTGLNTIDYVLQQLNNEFGQYGAIAMSRVEKHSEIAGMDFNTFVKEGYEVARSKSSSLIESESAENEFTKPAANLVMPSVFYVHGAITPVEMFLMSNRALGERTVNLKSSMRSAVEHLNTVLAILNSGDEDAKQKIASEFGDSVPDSISYVKHSIQALQLNDNALGRDYVPSGPWGNFAMKGSSLMIGGALTSVGTAGFNAAASPVSAFVLNSQLNRKGSLALGWTTAKFGARVGRTIVYRAARNIGGVPFKLAKKYLDKNYPSMGKFIDSIADAIYFDSISGKLGDVSGYTQTMKDADYVQSLGFSQSKGVFTSIMDSLRETAQYIDNAQEIEESTKKSKAGRLISVPVGTATDIAMAAMKKSLLELTDLSVNVAVLQDFRNLEDSYKNLAMTWAKDRSDRGMKFDPSNPDFIVRPDEYKPGRFVWKTRSEDALAQARSIVNLAGTSLEDVLWKYYIRSEGGKKDVPLFGDFSDSVKRVMIGKINSSTFTNRPTKSQTDPNTGLVQALTGFTSGQAVNMAIALKSSQKNPKAALEKLKRYLTTLFKVLSTMIALLSVGLYSSVVREWLNRMFVNRLSRKMTAYDKEFWTPDDKLKWRLLRSMFDVAPYVSVVNRLDEGYRPDIAGGIYVLSAANSVANGVIGALRVKAEDLPWLGKMMTRKHFGILDFASEQPENSPERMVSNAVAANSASAYQAGLVKPGVYSTGVVPITEKTPILARMNEAAMESTVKVQKGDTEAAAQAWLEVSRQKDRLVDYHRKQITENNQRRGIEQSESEVEKDANANARRDWQDLNPISRALGHQPTESELAAINANLSGDRRKSADLGWAAYSSMAELFPDSKGRTTEPQQQRREARRRGSSFGYSGAVRLGARRGGRSRGGRSRASSYGRSRSRSRSRRGARRVRLR